LNVFDLFGRKVTTISANSNQVSEPFNHEAAVYVAKIILENGTQVIQKIVNAK